MKEVSKVIGIGLALVDERIYVSQTKEAGEPIDSNPGGVTPNVLYAFAHTIPGYPTRLIARIGNDSRGKEYLKKHGGGFSHLQIDEEKNTGYCIYTIDPRNKTVLEVKTSYGAARNLRISQEELNDLRDCLFITDVYTLSLPSLHPSLQEITQRVTNEGGILALNLAGTNMLDDEDTIINLLGYKPDIVFGNKQEVAPFIRKRGIFCTFPHAEVLVETLGSKGSVIRYSGELIYCPPYKVNCEDIVNEIGVGDCFMGVMLASLFVKKGIWAKEHILKVAEIASYAASVLLTQKNQSRLDRDTMLLIQDMVAKL
ncbi:MAG: hypothetical protein COV26_01990 [Candidatus Nealsonbacteria bacterium CG10_big_fil_rev_8_21_14_0_10_36_23]|uniref:Carbohydrate kinase PfkB domain-containing protein n=1 Tax=Candidatus Nealsonbacteria bacterium CG10_big_fil_rev_8_21_14_0_10_36_23 TaxID=1974709 RepID=A0A2H0TKY3_9BACT|nr:MAG: hypothetical protein COV26_01990 [Candidatus Nealsonbacteria bacterium CG10_big_fil_rev_8_21_14_0_10_36_23]